MTTNPPSDRPSDMPIDRRSDRTSNQPVTPVRANLQPIPSGATGSLPRRMIDPVFVVAVVGFVLLGLIAVAVGGYLLAAVGTVAVVLAAIMALVPLLVVVFVLRAVDRWEPEPRPALIFAVLWGAAASVAMALLFSYGAQVLEAYAGVGGTASTRFLTTVVQAPIVEEFSKGLGVLILFWVFRRGFDGPVDGLVYAGTVAVGFAFTENIQYFGLALTNSDLGAVSETFFLRAVLSPFAHVMFTACTGVALGFASRRGTGVAVRYFLVGLVPAILLHALWNGATYVVRDFYSYYAVVQVPLFVLAIVVVVYLRRQEQRVTASRLAEYAAAGWFTAGEVVALSTGAGRSQAKAWAKRQGLARAFDRFVTDATKLAFARQRIISGSDLTGARRDEAVLLSRITEDRVALGALPPLPMMV